MGFAATDQDEYSKHDGAEVEIGTCCWNIRPDRWHVVTTVAATTAP
jgi:hypothetical protein